MGLKELEKMRDELDQLSVDASEVLTHALLMREKETGDGETYHGMIQVSLPPCWTTGKLPLTIRPEFTCRTWCLLLPR